MTTVISFAVFAAVAVLPLCSPDLMDTDDVITMMKLFQVMFSFLVGGSYRNANIAYRRGIMPPQTEQVCTFSRDKEKI